MRSTYTTSTIAGGRPGDSVTVRHLRVGGSPREIGRTLAAAAEGAHGSAAGPRRADPMLEEVRRQWFAAHYPSHRERLVGVADHFGLDPDDTRWSLDWLGNYRLPAGCSAAFYPGSGTKDGHGLLSRNFDFPTATMSEIVGVPAEHDERPLAADPWVVELVPDDGYASVVVGIMDVMGAMDGINEAGLSVALLADNETPEPEPTGGARVGLSEQQIARYLLDTCATVEDAKRALLAAKHYYSFTPCHYMVADRHGSSFVWEHSARRNREHIVEPSADAGGRLVCTNHLLHRWPDPREHREHHDPIGTAAFSHHRWSTLTHAIDSGAVVDRTDIRDQFATVRFAAPFAGVRTFWHSIYDVDSSTADLSFYTHDDDGVSQYTPPIRLCAAR